MARIAVKAFGGKMTDYMPWPREDISAVSGEQLLAKLKTMGIKERKPA